ncbi:sensor histidine kinase [Streptomyces cellostaticus]|uniref:sensor histidine kinase n=1 Tax=Streptomyces cellostaticus TaxID=67285 RepID=UPI002026A8D7|nr:HAMP domain-containing sensor histidine kinase [Streptomyces cellostaticus]
MRLPQPPIRIRLTLLYGTLFMACGVILLGVTYLLLEAGLADRFQAAGALFVTREDGITWVSEASHAPLAQDLRASPAASSPGLRELEESYRAVALQSLLRQGALALGGLTVVATFFGYVMAGRVLRPLDRIAQTAQRIASRGDLAERLAFTGSRDEVTRLADTFDTMMGRLEKTFQDQQRFIADASHELRTPLAINRTLIEVALRRRTATEDTRRLGLSLLTVNERNERLINGLLALAKGEAGIADYTPVDLAALARHTAELHQPQADAAGIGLRLEIRPVIASGNAVMVERIIHNLLENAVRYNGPHGWVRLTTGTAPDGGAALTVENTGPVVAGDDVEALFQPFRRLAADRTESERGSGLGLAIVRAIARSHGGEVSAHPRKHGGLIVTATLPRWVPPRSHGGHRGARRGDADGAR